jgi:hypothetical protein
MIRAAAAMRCGEHVDTQSSLPGHVAHVFQNDFTQSTPNRYVHSQAGRFVHCLFF